MAEDIGSTNKLEQLRRQAEKLLEQHPNGSTETPSSILELIHELRIHQIELEIQNEELQRAQHEFSKMHKEYKNLYEFAPCGYITLNHKGMITHINLTGTRLLGADRKKVFRQGMSHFIDSAWEDVLFSARAKCAETGEAQCVEILLKRKCDVPVWVRADIEADRNESDAVIQWRIVLVDISEQKAFESNLISSERRLRKIIQNMPIMMDALDEDYNILVWNRACEEITGYSSQEVIGNPDALKMLYPNDDCRKQMIAEMSDFDFKFMNKEFVLTCKDGTLRTISWSNISERFPVEGWHTWALGIDVSERKRKEELIRSSLEEKEILLRELHHRTKNNMQVIIAMLGMQKEKIGKKNVAAILDETMDRIQAMALVNEKLYQSENLNVLDLKDYFEDLIRTISQSRALDSNVEIHSKMENVTVDIDRAATCGLILNELISNSLKHGFCNNRKGKILVELCRNKNKKIELRVSDNGAGLPEGFDVEKVHSYGLQVVDVLIKQQLRGTLNVHCENGSLFIVRFENPGDTADV